ncbi:MAG TPA: hypothetical protein VFB78_02150 [Acidimicrobiales bacterium]|nr:hypothetical protein [Acidimicrobiales bacterium]
MTSSIRIRIRLGVAALAAVATTLVGTAALADTTTTTAPPARSITERRAFCIAQIDRRIVALDARQRELVNAQHLTDDHRAALNANLDATRDGLRALREQIRVETDRDAFKAECDSIWTSYRVFALVLPRTHLVTVADTELYAAGRLTNASTRLQQAIDDAKANGKDVTQAQADLDAMEAKVASGQASAAGVPASILSLTPADWNANHDVLQPAHDAAQSARTDLKAAGQLARQVVADLK